MVVSYCGFPSTCLIAKIFAIACSWGLAHLVSFPFFPNKLNVGRHWSRGEETGRQGMRTPKKMEQLKCKDRQSERKERELDHRFPMLCAPWQQCLLLACEFKMDDLGASHPNPAVCTSHAMGKLSRYLPWVSQLGRFHCTGS